MAPPSRTRNTARPPTKETAEKEKTKTVVLSIKKKKAPAKTAPRMFLIPKEATTVKAPPPEGAVKAEPGIATTTSAVVASKAKPASALVKPKAEPATQPVKQEAKETKLDAFSNAQETEIVRTPPRVETLMDVIKRMDNCDDAPSMDDVAIVLDALRPLVDSPRLKANLNVLNMLFGADDAFCIAEQWEDYTEFCDEKEETRGHSKLECFGILRALFKERST